MWWPFKKIDKKDRPTLRSVRFEPKPDITAYELLYIPGVHHLNKNPIGHVWPRDDYYEGLPDIVKRHFVELD